MVVGRLGQRFSHVAIIWVLSFGILDKCVCRWASLTPVSLLLYNMHVSCSNLQPTEPCSNSVLLRCAKASRWSAGKASPLLSGWGLSYNHSQCTHGRLQELDIPKIEMGTAVVVNKLWSIMNNTTANIHIPLTWVQFSLPADLHLCTPNCSCL